MKLLLLLKELWWFLKNNYETKNRKNRKNNF